MAFPSSSLPAPTASGDQASSPTSFTAPRSDMDKLRAAVQLLDRSMTEMTSSPSVQPMPPVPFSTVAGRPSTYGGSASTPGVLSSQPPARAFVPSHAAIPVQAPHAPHVNHNFTFGILETPGLMGAGYNAQQSSILSAARHEWDPSHEMGNALTRPMPFPLFGRPVLLHGRPAEPFSFESPPAPSNFATPAPPPPRPSTFTLFPPEPTTTPSVSVPAVAASLAPRVGPHAKRVFGESGAGLPTLAFGPTAHEIGPSTMFQPGLEHVKTLSHRDRLLAFYARYCPWRLQTLNEDAADETRIPWGALFVGSSIPMKERALWNTEAEAKPEGTGAPIFTSESKASGGAGATGAAVEGWPRSPILKELHQSRAFKDGVRSVQSVGSVAKLMHICALSEFDDVSCDELRYDWYQEHGLVASLSEDARPAMVTKGLSGVYGTLAAVVGDVAGLEKELSVRGGVSKGQKEQGGKDEQGQGEKPGAAAEEEAASAADAKLTPPVVEARAALSSSDPDMERVVTFLILHGRGGNDGVEEKAASLLRFARDRGAMWNGLLRMYKVPEGERVQWIGAHAERKGRQGDERAHVVRAAAVDMIKAVPAGHARTTWGLREEEYSHKSITKTEAPTTATATDTSGLATGPQPTVVDDGPLVFSLGTAKQEGRPRPLGRGGHARLSRSPFPPVKPREDTQECDGDDTAALTRDMSLDELEISKGKGT